MTTAAFCERDEFCTKILNKHWPDVPVHSDVRKLDGTKYAGSIDVVCGGFPCQPFSVSGQQRGKDDDRHLWPEMLRVISESKPRWVIGENVSGFVRMALDDVPQTRNTAETGYSLWATPAASTGGGVPTDAENRGWKWERTYWRRPDGSKFQTQLVDQVKKVLRFH